MRKGHKSPENFKHLLLKAGDYLVEIFAVLTLLGGLIWIIRHL